MGIIAWIILGLVAGVIAKALVPGRDPQGLIITTLIGVAGALLGGFLATRLFNVDGVQGFFNLSTWITAIAGSALLLLAYHLITSRGGRRRDGGRGDGRGPGGRSGNWAGRR
ncbi:GlsB/YeaQ/YmgE family stress response membrane protein [Actinomadura roseirufa]|uniref:GlsB/YeaQ/YmgE family stress response membrane protein n=1 Tax=Actinomadura roseirufa TaxID=2094049 RepID=UPI0010415444|nr:GlsB/YeaQ/YmgE family stress response membrane protein [Actinomadura roseirufa]